ncbi:MAG TPA: FAD-dependent oxidoreductase, partial [Gemmatimonadaceae bacterium]|nr:FAD-dependent oxidoreductase [Gemmatimonadaceae bacterium]
VERAAGAAHDFAIAARDFYPDFLERLADESGIRVPLNRLGILQVALTEAGVKGLRKAAAPGSDWLEKRELATMEPTLAHALGAVMNPDDGAVDNVVLISALEELLPRTGRITRLEGDAVKVERHESSWRVELASGTSVAAGHVVLSPGAWGATIQGVRYLRSVQPLRGQLIAFQSIGLRHVVYGPRGYLVPRATGTTIAGSTNESTGFDSGTTESGLAKVTSAAEEIAPGLAIASVKSAWAGLRPITPDMLPLLGTEDAEPGLVYACGHARNGILLAPLTGEVVASIVTGESLSHDLSQFRPARF